MARRGMARWRVVVASLLRSTTPRGRGWRRAAHRPRSRFRARDPRALHRQAVINRSRIRGRTALLDAGAERVVDRLDTARDAAALNPAAFPMHDRLNTGSGPGQSDDGVPLSSEMGARLLTQDREVRRVELAPDKLSWIEPGTGRCIGLRASSHRSISVLMGVLVQQFAKNSGRLIRSCGRSPPLYERAISAGSRSPSRSPTLEKGAAG